MIATGPIYRKRYIMNGSDFRRPGVPDPSEHAPGGIPPRSAGSSASPWRENQPLPASLESSEPHRVGLASPPARTSSGWLREPALDPRRLMPAPRHGEAPERSFSPAPVRTEAQSAPSAPPAERSHNSMPARPSQPAHSPSAPQPDREPDRPHGRFTERRAPLESAEPEHAEPQNFFTPRSSARPPRMEPGAKRAATPPRMETETEAASPSRFIAPTPSEPRHGREPISEPKAQRSAAPPEKDESFEIEPARPIIPPLWERLRDRTPLFRAESKRSAAQETNFAPHRFIAPPPAEPKPEKPAAAAPEAARSVTPPPLERAVERVPERALEREPAAPPQRFIAPAAVDRPPESASQPAAQIKATPAPLPPGVKSEMPPASANGRHGSAPASNPEQQWDPPRFEPQPPRERPRGFSALGEDEPSPRPAQPFELDQPPAASRLRPTAPAGHAPELQENAAYWAAEPPVESSVESAPPRFASAPPAERAPEWPLSSSANPLRTVAPPPFELEDSPKPPPSAAPPVSNRFSESPSPAAEPRRNHIPSSYQEDTEFTRANSAASARDERPHDSLPQTAAGTRRTTAPPPDPTPAHHPASPDPPERTRHWSALFEEDPGRQRIESGMEIRRAAPSERKPSPAPEPASKPAPASAEAFRAAPPPAPERQRDKAPLFASEPWRSSASPLQDMESAPEWPHAAAFHSINPEPEVPREIAQTEEDVALEESGDPMFPKLLKRLATVGRAALPIVPHMLPREGRIGATVSAVTAVSSALAAHAAHHAPAAPAAPNVDLAPIGDNLGVLCAAQRELRDKVADHTAVIERVQDQVDMLCEAANRVESEQRDLVAELKFFSKWALVFAVAVSVLLMAAVAFDVVLILRP